MIQALLRGCKAVTLIWLITLIYAYTVHAEEINHAVVLADSLNVRDQANAQGDVVGLLIRGTEVQTFGDFYGWTLVRHGNIEGWVAGYYLKHINKITVSSEKVAVIEADVPQEKSQETEASENETLETETSETDLIAEAEVTKNSAALEEAVSLHGEVNANALRLRKGPGENHAISSLLYEGEGLEITGKQGDWLQVVLSESGDHGWVYGSYVNIAVSEIDSIETPSIVKSAIVPDDRSDKSSLKGRIIVIDPGHGGVDTGAIGVSHGTEESEINLSTSFYLAEQLRELGAQVVMTRTVHEEKGSLPDRVKISELNRADAFISVHYNSATVPASGILTFYYSEQVDKPLAYNIDKHLGKMTDLKSNGISHGNYHILRNNSRPSVLVELGFLSNPEDEAIIRTQDYQQKAAKAIAEGLIDYFEG